MADAPAPAGVGAGPHRASHVEAKRRALLVGNPNVGKSVLFGALTGTYVTVSNYPGTTVEVTRGRVHAGEGDSPWELLDTPGTNNLVPMSEDEAVTRDILLSEPSDVLVQVGDAKNLARTLLLTLQLAELGVPFLLDLNMIDEARGRGIAIDRDALARELGGVRVHATAATSGEGIDGLRAYLTERHHAKDAEESRRPLACAPKFADDVEAAIAEIEAKLPAMGVAKRGVATMLLAGDRGFGGWLEANLDAEVRALAKARAEAIANRNGVPTFALLSKARLARAQAIVRAVQRKESAAQGSRSASGNVAWPRAAGVALVASLLGSLAYDGALAHFAGGAAASDPLDDFGFFDVCGRVCSRAIASGWSLASLALVACATAIGAIAVHRHASARAAAWKLVASFCVGYGAYWVASIAQGFCARTAGARSPCTSARWSASRRSRSWRAAAITSTPASRASSGATRRTRAGACPSSSSSSSSRTRSSASSALGTAVDFLENQVFGNVAANRAARRAEGRRLAHRERRRRRGHRAPRRGDGRRLRPRRRAGEDARLIRAGSHRSHRHLPGESDPPGHRRGPRRRRPPRRGRARVDGVLEPLGLRVLLLARPPARNGVHGGPVRPAHDGDDVRGRDRAPGRHDLLPRLHVLEDRATCRASPSSATVSSALGLNGKARSRWSSASAADDGDAHARIMETRRSGARNAAPRARHPVLAQLGVDLRDDQHDSAVAMRRLGGRGAPTILAVGWIAAKIVPGERATSSSSRCRRSVSRGAMNLVAKTLVRIEWYLREAVPLFLAGTALPLRPRRSAARARDHRAG